MALLQYLWEIGISIMDKSTNSNLSLAGNLNLSNCDVVIVFVFDWLRHRAATPFLFDFWRII